MPRILLRHRVRASFRKPSFRFSKEDRNVPSTNDTRRVLCFIYIYIYIVSSCETSCAVVLPFSPAVAPSPNFSHLSPSMFFLIFFSFVFPDFRFSVSVPFESLFPFILCIYTRSVVFSCHPLSNLLIIRCLIRSFLTFSLCEILRLRLNRIHFCAPSSNALLLVPMSMFRSHSSFIYSDANYITRDENRG